MTCAIQDENAAVVGDFKAPTTVNDASAEEGFMVTSMRGGPMARSRSNHHRAVKPGVIGGSTKSQDPSTTWGARQHPQTMDEARDHVAVFLQDSRHLNSNKILEIPTFDVRELYLGRFLGKGGFSNVEELRGILNIPCSVAGKHSSKGGANGSRSYDSRHRVRANSVQKLSALMRRSSTGSSGKHGSRHPIEDPSEYSSVHSGSSTERPLKQELGYEPDGKSLDETEDIEVPTKTEDGASDSTRAVDVEVARKFLSQNCVRETGEARYAIKRLRKEIVQDPHQYPSGAMDLAVEALFLTNLNHPNIVRLRGIGTTDPFISDPNHDDYYFLVLDRLYDTLTDRMRKWKERKRKLNTLIGRMTDIGGRKKQALLDDRLAAAFDLSAAMAYLKDNKIIHRDIKPENLGFDIRGDIKVFDFGLARELRDVDKDPDLKGMYRLSNMTGSLRYMAPEVASVQTPYNEACDVYSFTIVLWEMLSLERAYMTVGRTQEGFIQSVFVEKTRPIIKHSWRKNLRNLLERGWAHDPTQRLTAEQCNDILRNELVSMRHGDDEGLDHVRRRSTFVLDLMAEDSSESSNGSKKGSGGSQKGASPANGKEAQLEMLFSNRSASMSNLETLNNGEEFKSPRRVPQRRVSCIEPARARSPIDCDSA